jgi:hypothetical protein
VPDDGGQEFYVTLDWNGEIEPWVQLHEIPYLDTVPEPLVSHRCSREEAALALSAYLIREHAAQSLAHYPTGVVLEIVADWPEDIAQFNMLLVTGPGMMAEVPPLTFGFVALPGFSTAANSAVPHNALHDARALRDHVLTLEP